MPIYFNLDQVRHIDIYTDGAFSSKSKMGGWALVAVEKDEVIYQDSGYEPYTTNNRMELLAILAALRIIDEVESPKVTFTIHSDSAYCCNTFNQKWYVNWLKNGWKTADKEDVKNQDILCEIVIEKVAAHKDVKYNNMVDKIAVLRRKELEI